MLLSAEILAAEARAAEHMPKRFGTSPSRTILSGVVIPEVGDIVYYNHVEHPAKIVSVPASVSEVQTLWHDGPEDARIFAVHLTLTVYGSTRQYVVGAVQFMHPTQAHGMEVGWSWTKSDLTSHSYPLQEIPTVKIEEPTAPKPTQIPRKLFRLKSSGERFFAVQNPHRDVYSLHRETDYEYVRTITGVELHALFVALSTQAPSVGRIVHYQSYGTPGGEYKSLARAALVTQVNEDGTVGLCIVNPTGLFFTPSVVFSEENAPGTWNWPPRV